MRHIKTFTFLCSLFVALSVNAIPAKKGIFRTVTLPSGEVLRLTLCGDESLSYWKSDDGRRFTETKDNVFQKADMEALLSKRQEFVDKRREASTLKVQRRALGDRTHYTGKKKGLIILVNFADEQFQTKHNQTLYNNIANKKGFKNILYGFSESVKDYFLAVSNQQFELDFDVVGPFTLSKNYSYYGGNSSTRNDVNAGYMVSEACQAAYNAGTDFANYDWDGNGEADQVFVLYAGTNEAAGGGANRVWPHEYYLQYSAYGKRMKLGNTYVNQYACSSELSGNGKIDGIGTICHEFSHCMDLPDLYDTTQNNGNEDANFGMSSWSIMDSGGYSGGGFLPTGYTSYERWCSGWIDPIVLSEPTTVTGMKALSDGGDAYIIYNDNNENEYYLLENRQKTGVDKQAPGTGLLIIHVDYNRSVWQSNSVNTTSTSKYPYNDHQRCTIFHADNSNSYLAGDTYPYVTGTGTSITVVNNALTSTSTPSAMLYNANSAGNKLMQKDITNIDMASDGTISFDFMGGKSTAIQGVFSNDEAKKDNRIYSVSGKYMGTSLIALPKGIYIIGGKKRVVL